MESIEEMKQFLVEQNKKMAECGEKINPASWLETPEGIDKQLEKSRGNTAIIFYLDRSEMFDDTISIKTLNIKGMRVVIRGTKPKFITRTEWLELQPEAQ